MVKGSKTSVKINGLRVSVGSWLPTAAWECGRPGNGITDACGGSEGHWNCEDAGRSTGWRERQPPSQAIWRDFRASRAPRNQNAPRPDQAQTRLKLPDSSPRVLSNANRRKRNPKAGVLARLLR